MEPHHGKLGWDAVEQYPTALGLRYFSNAFRDLATMALEDLGFLPRGGKDVRKPPKEGASSCGPVPDRLQ
jgi:hypothetical protein